MYKKPLSYTPREEHKLNRQFLLLAKKNVAYFILQDSRFDARLRHIQPSQRHFLDGRRREKNQLHPKNLDAQCTCPYFMNVS